MSKKKKAERAADRGKMLFLWKVRRLWKTSVLVELIGWAKVMHPLIETDPSARLFMMTLFFLFPCTEHIFGEALSDSDADADADDEDMIRGGELDDESRISMDMDDSQSRLSDSMSTSQVLL